jgi:hypothetical protein
MIPYCGKIGRYCLSLWLTVGHSCNAVLAQGPMTFHGNFTNGKEILKSNDIRTPVSRSDSACITKILTFLACQENPCPSLFSSTRSTTASMGKGLGVRGWIELQYYVHIRNVQSSCCNIGSQE